MLWRWLEWGALYVLVPLALFFNIMPVNKFVLLALITLYALGIVLAKKPRFESTASPVLLDLAIRIPLIVSLIFLFSWLAFPAHFLGLPELHPRAWLLLLLFYPLISALPQEFLYRRFYFWRYETLFPTPLLMLGSNILLFAFMHIMYDNLVAITLSLLGGALFAISYKQTGRLLPVWIEHSVYGLAIFTSGLGLYFYTPLH